MKAAIIGMDNLNSTFRYDIFARASDDPMARGSWLSLLGWTTPSPATGDFTANTGELAVTRVDWDGCRRRCVNTRPACIWPTQDACQYYGWWRRHGFGR